MISGSEILGCRAGLVQRKESQYGISPETPRIGRELHQGGTSDRGTDDVPNLPGVALNFSDQPVHPFTFALLLLLRGCRTAGLQVHILYRAVSLRGWLT